MSEVKTNRSQERVIYGPNITPQSRYAENPPK